MEDPLVSFAVSWVTLHVSKVGSENFVNSWTITEVQVRFGALGKGHWTFMLVLFFQEFY